MTGPTNNADPVETLDCSPSKLGLHTKILLILNCIKINPRKTQNKKKNNKLLHCLLKTINGKSETELCSTNQTKQLSVSMI